MNGARENAEGVGLVGRGVGGERGAAGSRSLDIGNRAHRKAHVAQDSGCWLLIEFKVCVCHHKKNRRKHKNRRFKLKLEKKGVHVRISLCSGV